MGASPSIDVSSTSEIRAGLKPLMPWWQWIAGLMLFAGGFAVFPQTFDLPSITLFILVLVGINCDGLLLEEEKYRRHHKAGRVVQEGDHRVLVYREGRRRELKRMEFIFANAEDTSKVMLMFKRFLPNLE